MTTRYVVYPPSGREDLEALATEVAELRRRLTETEELVAHHGTRHLTIGGVDPTVHRWWTHIPALTGSTTDPDLGDDPIQWGRWYRVGNLIHYTFYVQFGTGVDGGAGTYSVSLPARIHSTYPSTRIALGPARFHDESTDTEQVGAAQPTTSDRALSFRTAGGEWVGAGAPWTWAGNDSIGGTVTYIAAKG